jgi:CRP/FNR family cyclic AMP-dependent transcriptional regulator
MPENDGIDSSVWAPSSFMSRLSADEQTGLLALGVTRLLRPGVRLFVEGGHDTHVEVLRQGFVKVTTAADGTARLLAVRLPGDLLGELAASGGGVRVATVTAGDDVISTLIRQADLLSYLAIRPRVAQQVTASVGERLRWANARRTEFTAYPVPVRLARVLGDLAAACGTPGQRGIRLNVPLNHAELAGLIGAAEDSVQRALRRLKSRGLVEIGYRTITVLDPEGLRELGSPH